jgi:hypothetical protein
VFAPSHTFVIAGTANRTNLSHNQTRLTGHANADSACHFRSSHPQIPSRGSLGCYQKINYFAFCCVIYTESVNLFKIIDILVSRLVIHITFSLAFPLKMTEKSMNWGEFNPTLLITF